MKMVLEIFPLQFTMRYEGIEGSLPFNIPDFTECFNKVKSQEAVKKILQEQIDMLAD